MDRLISRNCALLTSRCVIMAPPRICPLFRVRRPSRRLLNLLIPFLHPIQTYTTSSSTLNSSNIYSISTGPGSTNTLSSWIRICFYGTSPVEVNLPRNYYLTPSFVTLLHIPLDLACARTKTTLPQQVIITIIGHDKLSSWMTIS